MAQSLTVFTVFLEKKTIRRSQTEKRAKTVKTVRRGSERVEKTVEFFFDPMVAQKNLTKSPAPALETHIQPIGRGQHTSIM